LESKFNFCNKENFLNKCLTRNEKIEKISLEDFISCEDNIGNNRQTRMLADYGKDLDCSLFKEEKRRKLLENAKNILNQLSFFALNEFQHFLNQLEILYIEGTHYLFLLQFFDLIHQHSKLLLYHEATICES
jgi:hypothetical protein